MPGDESTDRRRGGRSLDELFEALACERRRRVLRYFRELDDDVATVDELADRVAPDGCGSAEVERIALGLHHVDLPKLAAAGIVEYDARSNVARYRGDERLDGLLDAAAAGERSRDAPSCGDR